MDLSDSFGMFVVLRGRFRFRIVLRRNIRVREERFYISISSRFVNFDFFELNNRFRFVGRLV